MCVVIDICALSAVFETNNAEHHRFAPVLDWISKGGAQLVFGGATYKKELAKAAKYIRIILEYKRAGRVHQLNDSEVDAEQKRIDGQYGYSAFHDSHLAAIIIVGRCPLLCTTDKRALPFIKDRRLYPNSKMVPKIYSGISGNKLLTRRHRGPCNRGNGSCQAKSVRKKK